MSHASRQDASRQDRSCHDDLFLAITRMACVYGVPLIGFVVSVGVAGLVFDLTAHNEGSIWLRAGACVVAALLTIALMRALTSHEPKWYSIGRVALRTRVPALAQRSTRRFGGTTLSPLPVGRSFNELRDYAG